MLISCLVFIVIQLYRTQKNTVFENHRKSLIQHCERSELRLHFEWTKVDLKCQKLCILTGFRKHKAYGHTVLPDRPLLKRTKIGRNGRKCQNLKILMRHFGWISNIMKMSHLNFTILAFSTYYCPINIDPYGNSVWPEP